jgi:hypothetical protein
MTRNDICFDEKFLAASNPNLIKVENDAGLNRFTSLIIIIFSFSGITIREANSHFKSLEEHLPI